MLRIVTGPFPDLEASLAGEVRQLKAAAPLAPLAIIVPSDSLRRRLKWLLCIEHGHALFDVHVLTFHQLAVRLLEEAGSPVRMQVRPEFFFKEQIHHLLRRVASGIPAWSGLVEMPGAWSALWATMRDLKDAKVDADRVLEALSQSDGADALQAGPTAAAALRTVLSLYRAFQAQKAVIGAHDQDDLAALAEACVPPSAFLHRQQRVLYYGFYDLTQVQLDLLQAVVRACPVTVFFPLIKGHPSFAFAERFFERYIHGWIAREEDWLQAPRERDSPSVQPCRVVSVAGPEDEVTVVAKDILGLVEERGYSFHDIGVVARTLSGYETVLPRVFEQHGIPFVSTMGRAFAEFPYAKTAVRLLQLRVSGYRRDEMMDVLASPFLRLAALCPPRPGPRPDLWDLASRRLGIVKGLDEWRRLTSFQEEGLSLLDDEDAGVTGLRIPGGQIAAAWSAVRSLSDAVGALPESGTWSEYVARAQELVDRFLDPRAAQGGEDGARLAEIFHDTMEELCGLTGTGSQIALADFVAALRRATEETVVPIGSFAPARAPEGVRVLDAMAARGVPFRALYILGLNEKVFPRHIQEDAFLRDSPRRFLETDLGFKIQEKLAGYDEEQLLFHVLCEAAADQLTLLYQRTDGSGRALVPSGYLEAVRSRGACAEMIIPRRLTKKLEDGGQYRPDRLTPAETGLKHLLERTVPVGLLEAVHPAGRLLGRSLPVLRAQEQSKSGLGIYDGMTGPLQTFWSGLSQRGVSPSALQDYATCPFRYFARQILRLESLVIPDIGEQVGPIELGVLAHRILRACLQELRTQGYFAQVPTSKPDPAAVLERAAREVFEQFAATHPVGYPLVWELQREALLGLLRHVLREDLADLAAGGWEPILFEEAMTGAVELGRTGEGGPESFPVIGRLDRVDWSPARHAYRIVDYKFKMSREPKTEDKNLRLGAMRGLRLQPPLYLAVARSEMPVRLKEAAGPPPACTDVLFYYLAPQWEQILMRVPFPGDAWTSDLRAPLERVIGHALGGIRNGRFFIYPNGYCDRCDYRLTCRKTHQPTSWRARSDQTVVKLFRDIRRTKLAGQKSSGKKT
jgi:ATP-dependent helicase/nuclease subunit B